MRRVVGIALILLISVSVSAQEKKVRIGLNGAPNLAYFKSITPGLEKDKPRFTMDYGVLVDINFSNNYAFATGINIRNTGGTLVYPDANTLDVLAIQLESGVTTRKYKLRYVEVPLTIKMKTNEIGYLTYFGQVGLGVGTKIGAFADSKFTPGSQLGATQEISADDENVLEEMFFFNVNSIINLGVEYNISGSTSLVFSLGYKNGLMNSFYKQYMPITDTKGEVQLVDNEIVYSDVKKKVFNNAFTLNIGIFF